MLVALGAGFVAGLAASATTSVAVAGIVSVIEPVGTLFVNAIRMTVIPLIFSKLVVAVASASDERALKRVGGSAVALFVAVVLLGAVTGAVAARLALPFAPVGDDVAALLTEDARATGRAASDAARHLPGFGAWFVGLLPSNVFEAAADGALLPLVLFALVLGLAVTRVTGPGRAALVTFFQGVSDAMVVLVRWILRAAPIGVFALTVPLVARLGLGVAGALGYYMALVAVACTAFALLVLYPLAFFVGRVPPGRFARATAPAQALAFSSRSSLATLPVMIEQGRTALGLPEVVTSFFLPVAAAMFRPGSAIGTTIGALFLARLYGVTLDLAQIASVVLTAVITMFGSPGVPSGAVIIIVPILASAGVPIEGIGILLAIDTLPDMFRTTTNITGHMSAATAVARLEEQGREQAGPRA
jgi:proton glutamate symport protein